MIWSDMSAGQWINTTGSIPFAYWCTLRMNSEHIYRHLVGQILFWVTFLKLKKSGSTAAFAWHCKKIEEVWLWWEAQVPCLKRFASASRILLKNHRYQSPQKKSTRLAKASDVIGFMHLASPGKCWLSSERHPGLFPTLKTMPLQFFALPHRKLRSDCRFLKQSPTQFPTGTRALNTNKTMLSFKVSTFPIQAIQDSGFDTQSLASSHGQWSPNSSPPKCKNGNAFEYAFTNMCHSPCSLSLANFKKRDTKLGKTTNRSVPTCQKLLVHAYWIGIAYSKESLNYPCFNQSLLSSLPNPNTLPRLQSHWP